MVAVVLSVGLVAAASVQAEDVGAKKIFIKDTPDPGKRQVQVQSVDPVVELSQAYDPDINGAWLHVYSATDDLCILLGPGESWQHTATKWKYKDKVTRNAALIANGKLQVKIKSGVTYTLADDASQGFVNAQVRFGNGVPLCMRCPGNAKDDAGKFLGKNCPTMPCDPEPSPCGPDTATTTTMIEPTSTTSTTSSTTSSTTTEPSTSTTSSTTSTSTSTTTTESSSTSTSSTSTSETTSTTSTTTTSTSTTTTTLSCYTFVTKWGGSFGSGNGQFQYPSGVAVDGSGNVFVTDYYNDRIQKFTNSGAFLAKWGSFGSANGQFNTPVGVAVDGSGRVFAGDFGNNRVQKFTNAGAFLAKWGTSGSGNGQFNGAGGVAADASGNIFVLDGGNYRVQKFSNTGTFITAWGSIGGGNGQFSGLGGIAVDSSGNVYVSDSTYDGGGYYYNNRIQKFTNTGTFVMRWGSDGSGNGQLMVPQGIAVDGAGDVFVADTFNHRVQKFTDTGTFLTAWGSFGTGDGQFEYPGHVAVDGSGNVFVSEFSDNNRVQKFACP